MRLQRIAATAAASVMLLNAAFAQEFPTPRRVHPLTGQAPADYLPMAQSSTVATVGGHSVIGLEPCSLCHPDRACGDSCGASDCGASDCGEGCGADECCSDSCLFGSTPLLSCLRNRKSCFSSDITYSVGGELRHRYMDEANRLRPGVPVGGARTDYNLWRFTPFVSMTYGDTFGGYVQAIDASAFGYDAPLTPVGIDVNRSDLLRFYAELNLGDVGGGNLKYRYGRQFLKYGSQHLLSPLAWANTFRNFQGHKLIWETGDWTFDAFSMAAVNGAAGGSGFSPTAADDVDSDRTVHGVYGTYNGLKNQAIDLYWIWSIEDNDSVGLQDGNRHTLGARFSGKQPVKECKTVVGTWDWDVEGAFQVGEDDFTTFAPGGMNQDVVAGFLSALVGYTFNNTPWTPSVSGIFYYGSGDDNRTDGTNNTFYSLYPLGHAYWGLIDNFSGQNLIDYGMQAKVKPHEKLTMLTAFHWFDRAKSRDAVYNIVGAPLATTNGGKEIGTELDLVATYTASETLSIQAGYFWFWYGAAISGGASARPDASQFYLQTTWAF